VNNESYNARLFAFDDILYLDNHLLVISKPSGITTLPDEYHQKSITCIMKDRIKTVMKKTGNVFLQPAHQIDKDVSGILVMARTSKSLSRLSESIRSGKWKKFYAAQISSRQVKPKRLTHYLKKEMFYTKVYDDDHIDRKQACLTINNVIQINNDQYIWIELHTGRYHQIRAQLAHIGNPIIGDRKYGSKITITNKIHLHHARVCFKHPTKDEFVEVEAPAPSWWYSTSYDS
jgi:23S rRNA pseudouridine1911/1915/1917 synthase